MRIGIVGNDSGQIAALAQELAHLNLLWVAGPGNGELGYPVYEDYSRALAEVPVDLIIDGTGQIRSMEAMVVPAAAALFLLGVNPRQESLIPSFALTDSAGQLAGAIERIAQQVQRLDDYALQLSRVGGNLDSLASSIAGDLERVGKILDAITRIAKRSKIIGLNSAIEAARVGELGRGFAVVAEEIKSLADDSSRSVQDIEKILEGIHRSSGEFAQRTGLVREVAELQQEITQEITAFLQALKELGGHMQVLAQEA